MNQKTVFWEKFHAERVGGAELPSSTAVGSFQLLVRLCRGTDCGCKRQGSINNWSSHPPPTWATPDWDSPSLRPRLPVPHLPGSQETPILGWLCHQPHGDMGHCQPAAHHEVATASLGWRQELVSFLIPYLYIGVLVESNKFLWLSGWGRECTMAWSCPWMSLHFWKIKEEQPPSVMPQTTPASLPGPSSWKGSSPPFPALFPGLASALAPLPAPSLGWLTT